MLIDFWTNRVCRSRVPPAVRDLVSIRLTLIRQVKSPRGLLITSAPKPHASSIDRPTCSLTVALPQSIRCRLRNHTTGTRANLRTGKLKLGSGLKTRRRFTVHPFPANGRTRVGMDTALFCVSRVSVCSVSREISLVWKIP